MLGFPLRLALGMILGAVAVKEWKAASEFYDHVREELIRRMNDAKESWYRCRWPQHGAPATDAPRCSA